jgi:asparagine N-glycosylation enzyme membrane subunit Stt3
MEDCGGARHERGAGAPAAALAVFEKGDWGVTGAGDPDRRGPQLAVCPRADPARARGPARRGWGALGYATAVAGLVALAAAARSLDWPLVFPGDGRVWLDPFDGAYRVRRALYTFEHFPHLLRFDPWLGFPAGVPVPAPPLYDWLLGATARALGSDVGVLERVAAWTAPVLAALAVLPVAAAGRSVGSRGIALAAAAIYALLPIAVNFSRVGDADHHAAVALLGSLLLAQTLRLARGAEPRRTARLWIAVALARAALVLTWSGSLLYVVVADGVLLGLGILAGRSWLTAHALGLVAGAALLAPAAAAERAGGGPPLTATTFSWLHVLALTGLAVLAAALALAERIRPARNAGARALRAAGLAALALGALAALPPLRAALAPSAAFLAREDRWGHANLEQRPLFAWMTSAPLVHGRPPASLYGGFAWLIPLAPLAALARARDPRRRRAALALAAWSGALGALALAQVRFGNDFSPAGAVCFALLLGAFRDALARRLPAGRAAPRLADAAALAAGTVLLWPALDAVHRPALERAVSLARVPALAQGLVETSGNGSLRRFAETVRRAAPDPAADRDPFARPAFGVLAPPNFGYALLYFGRRAVPASNAGPYVDPALLDAVFAFFAAGSESPALAIARRLDARYVLTADHEALAPGTIEHRLQREAGSAQGAGDHLGHFRLVAEGPERGRPLAVQFRGRPPRGAPAYRLFEVVRGALVRVRAAPGAELAAEVALASPLGRSLTWRARARAGPDGWAQLRVPHATRGTAPVRPLGPYRIRGGGLDLRVEVTEAQVRGGAVVEAGARAADARAGNPPGL